jgi:hypothetical protein
LFPCWLLVGAAIALSPFKLYRCKTQIGPHHVASAADIYGLLWASSNTLPIGNGEIWLSLSSPSELAKWIPGNMVDGSSTAGIHNGRARLVKLQLPHLGPSWHCDFGQGLLLLRTSCVSLLPRPLRRKHPFGPTPQFGRQICSTTLGKRRHKEAQITRTEFVRQVLVLHWKDPGLLSWSAA